MLTVLCACSLLAGCRTASRRVNPGEVGPIPHPITPATQETIRAAIDRGVAFLVKNQNPNGCWGKARYKGMNVGVSMPMGHIAMRTAASALCVRALIEAESKVPGAAECLQRAEDWLLETLPKVRRSSFQMFNNWAHAYGIQALVRMLQRQPMDPERRETIHRVIRDQLDRLSRGQHLDGGWGYYAEGSYQRPIANSMSFITATVLLAMHEARQAGFAVPKAVTDRAVEGIRKVRRPDFAYGYGFYHRYNPMYEINQPPGSLARSQVCNAASYVWGDQAVTLKVIKTWLNRIIARHGWLSMARKSPFPHASHYRIAAYFFYYGHYYAAVCIDLLPPEERPPFQDHLAYLLLPRQEKDGSWWDFPLYDYHQAYGTAFAIMSLTRCYRPPVAVTLPEGR